MATSLQQQLAAINAKSTDQLNLKVQKERHSRSLLFEPREAAGQTFDALFQICHDGFTELCLLDRQFKAFSANLFAPGSVSVEREHMPAQENAQLDKVVEEFLGLVSGKLLLRPAQKSVEWLIRRWRIHEYNPALLVYAFLPYHDHESFSTVLSLLPKKKLPPSLHFLKPYIAALQTPPKHVISSAAVSNPTFLQSYTSFVLGTAERKQQSSIMLGLWTSTLARATGAMLDSAQTGREEVERQRMEDVMTKMLPILEQMLAISTCQELFLAACLLMTLLASKGQLVDSAIDTLMDSVVRAASINTRREAIECLVLLAEEKDEAVVTKKIAKFFIKTPSATKTLIELQTRLETNNLVTGVLTRCIRYIKAQDLESPSVDTMRLLLTTGLVADTSLLELRRRVAAVTLSTPQANSLKEILPPVDDQITTEHEDLQMLDDLPAEPEDRLDEQPMEGADTMKAALPTLPNELRSFFQLSHQDETIFEQYSMWFQSCCKQDDEAVLADLMSLPGFKKDARKREERLLTFLAVFWSDASFATAARVKAIMAASGYVTALETNMTFDLQSLIPSLLSALGDQVKHIRRAAAQGFLQMMTSSKATTTVTDNHNAHGGKSDYIVMLGHEVWSQFFQAAIVPRLEDCVLDPQVASTSMVEWLNQSHSEAVRVCEALASHIRVDRRDIIADTILSVLQQVGKNAAVARQSVLCPFIRRCLNSRQENMHVFHQTIKCLTSRTSEEVEILKQVATGGSLASAEVAFSHIAQVYRTAQAQDKQMLLSWLVDCTLDENSQGRNIVAADALDSVDIPVDALSHQLSSILNRIRQPEQGRSAKRVKTDRDVSEGQPTEQQMKAIVKAATVCLELIEDSLKSASMKRSSPSEEKTRDFLTLFRGLFNLLSDVQRWRSWRGHDFTYLQGLILSNMVTIITLAKPSAEQLDASTMRTDQIVDLLRSSSSPQVHNNALLLISRVAVVAPDSVLHSVMPLFTFMSSATLRQADAHSGHVIAMTIDCVVPPLVSSLKKRGKDLVTGASDLLLSFVAAYEHIPSHRRLSTFVHLIKTLGPQESLSAVLAMLVERYPDDSSLAATARGILCSFPVDISLAAMVKYARLVVDGCKPRRKLSDAILGFAEKKPAERHASITTMLRGYADMLSDSDLRKKVAVYIRKGEEQVQQLRVVWGQALELLVPLPDFEGNVINFTEPGLKSAYSAALEAHVRVLPDVDFIESSGRFMAAGTEAVRCKIFESLTTRVTETRTGDLLMAKMFLEALPNCAAFLTEEQPVSVRQAALSCMDAISEKFGRLEHEAVSSVIKTINGPAALASDSPALQTASLLCLASAVEVLRSGFADTASDSVQLALDHVQTALRSGERDIRIIDAAFSFINALLDYEAWLLTGADLLDRAITLACTASQVGISSWSIGQFCELAPKKIDAGSFNATLLRIFDDVLDAGLAATTKLVQLEHAAIQHHTKKEVLKHASSFQRFMLRAFEIREALGTQLADVTPEFDKQLLHMNQACRETTQATLALTLKLNDISFRPFFIQLVELAGQNTSRAIAFYDFAFAFFEQLGSIVTSFASFILDNAAEVIVRANTSATSSEEGLLLNVVLAALSASFKHDQDDFWTSTSHFGVIAEPLLNLMLLPAALDSDVVSQVVVNLAAAVSSSPELLKSMNKQLMTFLRNEDAAIRLAAIKCQRAITERLTFDWLNLLPEMLPFISEALEDDDEGVEREVLRWVSQLEEVTGESLEGMLA